MKRFSLVIALLLSGAVTTFAQYTNELENSTTQTVDSVWTLADDLHVGIATSGNSMFVTNGGVASVQNVFIGATNTASNLIRVEGSNAFLNVGGDLSVAGSGNLLDVTEQGIVDVTGDLLLNAGTVVSVGTNSTLTLGANMNVSSTATVSGTGSVLFSDSANNILTFDWANSTISSSVLFDGQGGTDTLLLTGGAQDLTAADFAVLNHTNFTWLNLGDGADIWLASDADADGTFGSISNISGGADFDRLKYSAGQEPGKMADTGIGSTYFDFEAVELGATDDAWEVTGLDAQWGILVDGAGGTDTLWMTNWTFAVSGSLSNRYVNFENLNLTDSTLSGFGAVESFDSVNLVDGVISPGDDGSAIGRLEIAGDFAASGTVYRAQIDGDQNDELIFKGSNPVDLSQMSVEVNVEVAPTSFTSTVLTAVGGISSDFEPDNVHVTESFPLYDAKLTVVGNEVQVDVYDNNKKFSSALAYAEVESVRAGFNSMKGSVFARTKQLRRNMVATAQALSRDAYLLSAPDAPEGPQGPGDDNAIFDMNVWVQQYSGQGDFDAAGDSFGYRLNNNGTTFGIDKVIGDGLIAGLNYTYARSAARTTNADRLDSETYWVGAYAEWVGEDGLYVDALAAWGRSNFDSERIIEESSQRISSYRGYNIGAYADVGQYYHHENLALSPYAGLHFLSSQSDAHTETEIAVEGETFVSKQDHTSLEAVLGLKLRHRFDADQGRFQTTAYAEYAHDVIQEDVYATLAAAGLAARNMARITPDADVVNTGIGISWICTDALEIGLGYNGRFSDQYEEHTTTAMLNVRF